MMQPDPTTVVENLALVLMAARKKRKLSHQALAERAGVHRSTISLIESGKIVPTILVCLKIAQALEMDLAALLRKARKTSPRR